MVRRVSPLVASMLAFLAAFATIAAEEIPQGVMPKRQVVGTGNTPSSTSPVTSNTPITTPTSNNPPASNTPSTNPQNPSSVSVTTTQPDGSSTTTNIDPSSVTSEKTTALTTTNSKGESVVKVGSTTIDPNTLSKKTTVRQPLVTKETHRSTLTSFYTSDGQRYSSIYTTKNVVASTTGFATATIAPGLANGGGNGANLSTSSKKVIGGVVGGIGGAILIGGLAFVAWRLWGKKKAAAGAGDGEYYDGSTTDSMAGHKRESMGVLSNSGMSESGGAALGTQTTGLERYERYQNPSGTINTASNF